MDDGFRPAKVVKCEGRFSELREYLYGTIFPLFLNKDRAAISRQDLKDTWDLLQGDIHNFDRKDSYYLIRGDSLRKLPNSDYLSLVPLIESPSYHLEEGLLQEYAESSGNNHRLSSFLGCMQKAHPDFFRDCLGRASKTIMLPCGKTMSGYVIAGNAGIGTISNGGKKGGGVRSDSPYLLEIYSINGNGHHNRNLAAVVGFWAQDNRMLVSQMQPCGNAHYPEEVPFGVASLHIAEVVASSMGFNDIVSYSGRNHPLFKEHPDSRSQLEGEFVCIWDSSAAKLGFEGTRHTYHSKHLNGNRF